MFVCQLEQNQHPDDEIFKIFKRANEKLNYNLRKNDGEFSEPKKQGNTISPCQDQVDPFPKKSLMFVMLHLKRNQEPKLMQNK